MWCIWCIGVEVIFDKEVSVVPIYCQDNPYMGSKTKEFSSPYNWLTYTNVRKKSRRMVWNFSYDVRVFLIKSEKLAGRGRWLSSYDKSVLRTLEVFDVFFTRYLERNSPKLFFMSNAFRLM